MKITVANAAGAHGVGIEGYDLDIPGGKTIEFVADKKGEFQSLNNKKEGCIQPPFFIKFRILCFSVMSSIHFFASSIWCISGMFFVNIVSTISPL